MWQSSPSICFNHCRVRVTLHLGPHCIVGSDSPCDGNGGLSQGTPSSASPYQLPERIEVHSLEVGQVASPELDLR